MSEIDEKIKPHWWAIQVLPEDVDWVEHWALKRNQMGRRKGMVSKTKDVDLKWDRHGVMGEWAVSLALFSDRPKNLVRGTLREMHEGDLPLSIEVKCRAEKDPRFWDLAVNDYDLKEDRVYVLALGCFWPKFVVIVGWAYGHEVLSRNKVLNHAHSDHRFYVLEYNRLRDLKTLLPITYRNQ